MSPIDNPTALVRRLVSLPAETEWVEFKENNASPVQIGRDICALANAATLHEIRYAYKLWGVTDDTHEIVGTTFDPLLSKQGNQSLELWLRLKLSPNVQFEFESVDIEGKRVVILRILPALYQIALFDNKPYIRSGSSTHELKRGSAQEIDLWRKVQREIYETQVARSGLSIEELLSLLDYTNYFARIGIPVPESRETIFRYLEKESLSVQDDNGLYAITNLGALLFARDLSEFPEVARKAVRVIQYEGNGRISMLRDRTFSQGYAVCLDEVLDYLMTLLPSREVISRATRVTVRQFPEIAVRELVANALIHQDFGITGAGPMIELFDHRLEVTNPGTPLVDPMRIVNDPPRARNEKMASLMRRLGLSEEAGSGWDKIIEACEFYTLPAPRIETPGGSTQVTLFADISFKNLMPEERELACYWHACIQYAQKTAATNQSIRKRFGLDGSATSQISRLIKACVDKKLIRPLDANASKKNMCYVPYWV